MIVIIAGDAWQAEDYARDQGLERRQWLFPRGLADLAGRRITGYELVGTWHVRTDVERIMEQVKRIMARDMARDLTTSQQVEETSHMTTTTQAPVLYNVNADPADAATGHAVLGLILAAAARRPHLRGSIESFQFTAERGIGILVEDAGHRQHLANAIGLPAKVETFRVSSPAPGVGYKRCGGIEGIAVTIWNFEA